jgi:hypothetical protein
LLQWELVRYFIIAQVRKETHYMEERYKVKCRPVREKDTSSRVDTVTLNLIYT